MQRQTVSLSLCEKTEKCIVGIEKFINTLETSPMGSTLLLVNYFMYLFMH